jgi:hypothetical protein
MAGEMCECSAPLDRTGLRCRACCDRQRAYMRRRRGWDGHSPWTPRRQSAASQGRRYVGTHLPDADHRLLMELVRREGTPASKIVREAVSSYLNDIFEDFA